MLLVGARCDLGAVGGEGSLTRLLGSQDRAHQIEAGHQCQLLGQWSTRLNLGDGDQSLPAPLTTATVVAVIIDKPAYVARYPEPANPYDYAMETGLERVFRFLEGLGQEGRLTPVIVECRGRKEDNELELAFRRVCGGRNTLHKPFPFQMVMIPKTSNSAGLQLTDLMARPVGIRHLRPDQPNRAYEVIASKFRRSPAGKIEGWGLKVIP